MNNKLFLFLTIGIFFSLGAMSQNEKAFKPYFYGTASVGVSLKQILKDTLFQKLPTKSTPVIELSAQKRPIKNLTFGFCFAYQNFNTEDTRNTSGGNLYIKTTLYNPGVLAAYNFYLSSSFDFYLQTKLNYQINQVTYKLVYSPANVNTTFKIPMDYPNQYTFQFAAGFNYYFSENLGIHMEGAIGNPYMFKIGINVKLNTNNSISNLDRKIERVEPKKSKNYYN